MIDKKIKRMNEMAYVLGLIIMSLGVCFTSKGGFGVSMVISPAYVLHLSLVDKLPWLTFGTAEYLFQGVLLIIVCLVVRRFRWQYLLCFITALIYGLLVDMWLYIFGTEQYEEMYQRILSFVFGIITVSFSVALFFRTYMPLEVYELAVTETSARYKIKQGVVKWVYDIISLIVAVVMTLIINKTLLGIGVGTIICAIVNAPMITLFGKLLDRFISFDAYFPQLEARLKTKGAEQ